MIKVLLVDDEFLALQLLENYVKQIPDLHLVGKTKSPIEAVDILNSTPVDLLYLDIQMPTLSGINLLKTLNKKPQIIFTTAYPDYALDAYELDVVDYLLKPFSFERFLQATNKAKLLLQKTQTIEQAAPLSSSFIVVKSDAKTIKIEHQQILFIEGLKEYVKFVCTDGTIVVLESLKNLVEILPSNLFLRVHKSYIVNISKVKSIEGNRLEIDQHKIPVSREQKNNVVKIIFG